MMQTYSFDRIKEKKDFNSLARYHNIGEIDIRIHEVNFYDANFII